jgi:CheY-like chemotaxis protein
MHERILVVDDDPDTANTLGRLIGMFGYKVTCVCDGGRAVAEAASRPPEMAFIDLEMPDVDGCETARRIRSQPGGTHVLLVAVTGWTRPEDKRRAYDAGFDLHVAKPLDLETLKGLLGILDPQACRIVVA